MNIKSVLSAGAKRSAICAAIAAAGVVMAPAAHADSYTTSTGNTITVTVSDLNLTDGVAAAITFNSGASIADFANFWFADVAHDTGTDIDWAEVLTIPSETFRLTANSAVTFTVNYGLEAYATGAGEESSTTMSLSVAGNGVSDTDSASTSASFASGMTSNAGMLSVSFANTTGSKVIGVLSGLVSSSGFGTTVAAIPEPGTYAMFLAGLAAMGAVARRRRVK